MHLSDLLFTGFNKRVAALHRDTGEILWQWKAPFGMSYTSLLLDGDRLIVSVDGYMYALDPFTGRQLWMNEMKGFGTGIAILPRPSVHRIAQHVHQRRVSFQGGHIRRSRRRGCVFHRV